MKHAKEKDAEVEVAAQDAADGRHDLGRVALLHDVALSARPQHALGIEPLLVHRQHEHGQVVVKAVRVPVLHDRDAAHPVCLMATAAIERLSADVAQAESSLAELKNS